MTVNVLLDEFRSGTTIYLPGATGEILALAEALAADPQRMAGVHVVSCLLPGMNMFDYAALDPAARLTTFLLPPAMRGSFSVGRVRLMPLSYSGIATFIGECAGIDTAIAHVSPPDSRGQSSFGIAADFSPIAWARARRRVAVVNPLMPGLPGPTIALSDADLVVEMESPLVTVRAADRTPEIEAIVAHAAALVPDGAALQIGLGGAPAGLWAALTGHRGLRVRSGLVAEGLRTLADCGALDIQSAHRAGIACGDTGFYAWLKQSRLVTFADTRSTHDATSLAAEDRFVAANSALEIDLFGQVNLEWQNGRVSSGVGGAPDFVRAALVARGGRSMVLLPSTARAGQVSRVVASLSSPTASLSRDLVDTVVTEHGVAELRGLSLDERAAALIAIAGPVWRDGLERGWREIRAEI